jgi:hypothetical protein
MAKVEGSNPFIRFKQNPRLSGGFVRYWDRCTGTPHPVGTTRGYHMGEL